MNNKKILVSVLFIILVLIMGFSVYKSKNIKPYTNPLDQVPVTEFEDSNIPPGRIAAGYVTGHVDIGPNCPGPEKIDEPCRVPDEAYSMREVIVYASDASTVKERGKINSEGNYKLTLAPGNYFLQIQPAGIREGEKMPVTVKSFETAVVNFQIDTGIR